MTSLQFSDYEFEKYGYMKAPQPKLNGGLYSGEAFNGAHGNVPVMADGEYMTTKNLKSANPPTEGLYHYPGYTRPGNNKQELPGTKQYSNIHSFRCLSNKELLKRKNGLNLLNGGSNGYSNGGSNNIVEGFEEQEMITGSNISKEQIKEVISELNIHPKDAKVMLETDISDFNIGTNISEFDFSVDNLNSDDIDINFSQKICPFTCDTDSQLCPCYSEENKKHDCYPVGDLHIMENIIANNNCYKNIQNYCCNVNKNEEYCKSLEYNTNNTLCTE